MHNELALRYLLLRHLKALSPSVPRERFEEVARTLRVEIDRDDYSLSWCREGQARETRLPRSHFEFYGRGDSRPGERSRDEDLRTANDARARAWATAALATPAAPPATVSEPLESYRSFAVLESAILSFALWLTGGLGTLAACLLLALLLLEHRPHGRLWTCALLLPLAFFAPPIASAAVAVVFGLLQFLDPSGAQRGLRITLCVGAAAVAGFGLGADRPSPDALLTVVLGATAILLTIFRALHGSHRRVSPLALPCFCWALVFDGHDLAAGASLAWLLVATVLLARLPHILPVQREQELDPNG